MKYDWTGRRTSTESKSESRFYPKIQKISQFYFHIFRMIFCVVASTTKHWMNEKHTKERVNERKLCIEWKGKPEKAFSNFTHTTLKIERKFLLKIQTLALLKHCSIEKLCFFFNFPTIQCVIYERDGDISECLLRMQQQQVACNNKLFLNGKSSCSRLFSPNYQS